MEDGEFYRVDEKVVAGIPIEYINWVDTKEDLSAIGFIRKEGTNRWFNSKYYRAEEVDNIKQNY